MISRLRKQITVFLWFAAALFIAFIFFQWGMQFTSSRRVTQSQRGVVAEINGQEISTIAYNNLVRNYTEMGLSDDEASDSAFYVLLEGMILRHYYDKEGLSPSDREVVDAIKTNPPPQILQDTLFYTDGKFDYLKYAELFRNRENIRYFNQYEAWIRDVIPRQRLYTQIVSTVQPTATINQYLKNETKFTVEYGEIEIDKIKVDFSEEDLLEYYESSKELFKRPGVKLIQYVKFDLKPSLEDESLIMDEANDIISQYESGIPFDTLALRFSDDAKSKRALGYIGFVKRGDLNESLEKAIFSMSAGDVKGPIKTYDGLYIFKCLSRSRDSIEVSQIFIKLAPSYETVGLAMDKALSFADLADEMGFENAAAEMNLELRETTSNELAGLDLSKLLTDRNIGKISQPVHRKDGIFVWFYKSNIPERVPAFSEIKDEVRTSYLRAKREELIMNRLAAVKREVESGSEFRQALKDIPYKKIENFSISEPRSGMPSEPAFYGAIWALNEGILSEPIIGKKYCYIIKCLKREQPGTDRIQEEFAQYQAEVWRETRNKAFEEWIKTQISKADVKDYRYQM